MPRVSLILGNQPTADAWTLVEQGRKFNVAPRRISLSEYDGVEQSSGPVRHARAELAQTHSRSVGKEPCGRIG